MKTKFMAAAAAWWLKARAFAKACLESTRNPYRLFWTAAAAIAVAVSSVLVPSSAFAHGGTDTQQAHVGGGCNSQYKVSHGDSDCLAAWWDNTPPASTGHAGGSTFGAKTENDCDDYGEVRAHIDMLNTGDTHFHLTDSSKYRGYLDFNNISGISCCINESDLCYKQQVEKNSRGRIKVWTGTGTTMEKVNVRTHAKRYAYCSEFPDSIYCVNDEDGDAFIDPNNCGDHLCTVADCQTAFEASDAYEQCQSDGFTDVADPTYSISATDGSSQTCTVTANCWLGHKWSNSAYVSHSFHAKTISADVEDIDDIVNCYPGAQLAVGAC